MPTRTAKMEQMTTTNLYVKGYMALEKIRCFVANELGAKIQGNAVRYHDTDGIYEVYVMGRTNAAKVAEVKAFVRGCLVAMVASGMAAYHSPDCP